MMKVILDNKLDLLIQLHTALPPGKIGLAPEPNLNNRQISYPFGPNAGITEILIPAGYVRTAYDPKFELATDANGRKVYRSRHRHGAHGNTRAGPAVLDQFPGRAGDGALWR